MRQFISLLPVLTGPLTVIAVCLIGALIERFRG